MTHDDYSAYLIGIETGARMAARNALMLPKRPNFETNAEAELERAFKVLAGALDAVITAQKEYRNKPVDA